MKSGWRGTLWGILEFDEGMSKCRTVRNVRKSEEHACRICLGATLGGIADESDEEYKQRGSYMASYMRMKDTLYDEDMEEAIREMMTIRWGVGAILG